MKRKNIDTMREIRLWIRDIGVPIITVIGTALAIPEVRDVLAWKTTKWKASIEEKIRRKEKEIQ